MIYLKVYPKTLLKINWRYSKFVKHLVYDLKYFTEKKGISKDIDLG